MIQYQVKLKFNGEQEAERPPSMEFAMMHKAQRLL